MKNKIMTRFLFSISLVVGGYVITKELCCLLSRSIDIEIVLNGFTIVACLLYVFFENRIMARMGSRIHSVMTTKSDH